MWASFCESISSGRICATHPDGRVVEKSSTHSRRQGRGQLPSLIWIPGKHPGHRRRTPQCRSEEVDEEPTQILAPRSPRGDRYVPRIPQAVRDKLPKTKARADPFRVIAWVNPIISHVSRRRSHEVHAHRDCACDPAYKCRKLRATSKSFRAGEWNG